VEVSEIQIDRIKHKRPHPASLAPPTLPCCWYVVVMFTFCYCKPAGC